MQEIERFFGNLLSGLINRFKYGAMDTAERKAREAIDQQLNQQKKSTRENQEDRK